MNILALVIAVAASLFVLEIFFFLFCFRWLSQGKKQREKEFALLDEERSQLFDMQGEIMKTVASARTLANETLERISHLGTETHAEWHDINSKFADLVHVVETRSKSLVDENLALLQKHRMSLEKVCKESKEINISLLDTLKKSEKVLRFFDKNVPADQIVKDIQVEKYAEARRLIEEGVDASLVARRLSLSHSEISLLSYIR